MDSSQLATMKKVISKDGTPIAFDQSGKGPAVIFVGGAFQHRAIDPRTAQLAAGHGLAITKLALYEPPFNLDDNARPASENYTKQLTALLAEGRRGDAVALAMTTFGAPAEAVAGMRETPIWSMFESVAPTLAYDNAIMGDGSVPSERMASVTVPTLVIDGGASPAFMHNAAQAARSEE